MTETLHFLFLFVQCMFVPRDKRNNKSNVALGNCNYRKKNPCTKIVSTLSFHVEETFVRDPLHSSVCALSVTSEVDESHCRARSQILHGEEAIAREKNWQ